MSALISVLVLGENHPSDACCLLSIGDISLGAVVAADVPFYTASISLRLTLSYSLQGLCYSYTTHFSVKYIFKIKHQCLHPLISLTGPSPWLNLHGFSHKLNKHLLTSSHDKLAEAVPKASPIFILVLLLSMDFLWNITRLFASVICSPSWLQQLFWCADLFQT